MIETLTEAYMVKLARIVLIVMAYLLLPIYALWIFGGWCADRIEKRRFREKSANK